MVAIAKIQLALARRVQLLQQHQSCQGNGPKESVLQTRVWRLSLQVFSKSTWPLEIKTLTLLVICTT